jgi:hypothetical protein
MFLVVFSLIKNCCWIYYIMHDFSGIFINSNVMCNNKFFNKRPKATQSFPLIFFVTKDTLVINITIMANV